MNRLRIATFVLFTLCCLCVTTDRSAVGTTTSDRAPAPAVLDGGEGCSSIREPLLPENWGAKQGTWNWDGECRGQERTEC